MPVYKGWWAGVALLFLAGCLPGRTPAPSVDYRLGAVLLEESFDSPSAWYTFDVPVERLMLTIEDGVYRIQVGSTTYAWALSVNSYENVMIEVQTSQRSEDDDNAFGLICRGDPSYTGSGYYFFVSSDGYASIRVGSGGQMRGLVDFEATDTINHGRAINSLRVLCIDDYLALYVNGKFVMEARDSRYTRGMVGMVAGNDNATTMTDIGFDELRVVEARAVEEE